MFVVLGASGNTGKVVAETLVRQRKKVLHFKGAFVGAPAVISCTKTS